MRIALFLVAVLTMTGCVDMDSLIPEKGEPADKSFYLVDTKFRFICLGETSNCRDMTKIVSSRSELKPIEEAYGKEVTGPNYPVTLARIIMYPEDGSYKAQPIGSDGRFFSVPVNEKTNIVWETLTSIEKNLFNYGS